MDRRASILKIPKLRDPLRELSNEENLSDKAIRKVRFSSHFVKEYATTSENSGATIWDNTYEEAINKTDDTPQFMHEAVGRSISNDMALDVNNPKENRTMLFNNTATDEMELTECLGGRIAANKTVFFGDDDDEEMELTENVGRDFFIAEQNDRKILKTSKRRDLLENLSNEQNFTDNATRKVRFNSNFVKGYTTTSENSGATVWDNTYEEAINRTDETPELMHEALGGRTSDGMELDNIHLNGNRTMLFNNTADDEVELTECLGGRIVVNKSVFFDDDEMEVTENVGSGFFIPERNNEEDRKVHPTRKINRHSRIRDRTGETAQLMREAGRGRTSNNMGLDNVNDGNQTMLFNDTAADKIELTECLGGRIAVNMNKSVFFDTDEMELAETVGCDFYNAERNDVEDRKVPPTQKIIRHSRILDLFKDDDTKDDVQELVSEQNQIGKKCFEKTVIHDIPMDVDITCSNNIELVAASEDIDLDYGDNKNIICDTRFSNELPLELDTNNKPRDRIHVLQNITITKAVDIDSNNCTKNTIKEYIGLKITDQLMVEDSNYVVNHESLVVSEEAEQSIKNTLDIDLKTTVETKRKNSKLINNESWVEEAEQCITNISNKANIDVKATNQLNLIDSNDESSLVFKEIKDKSLRNNISTTKPERVKWNIFEDSSFQRSMLLDSTTLHETINTKMLLNTSGDKAMESSSIQKADFRSVDSSESSNLIKPGRMEFEFKTTIPVLKEVNTSEPARPKQRNELFNSSLFDTHTTISEKCSKTENLTKRQRVCSNETDIQLGFHVKGNITETDNSKECLQVSESKEVSGAAVHNSPQNIIHTPATNTNLCFPNILSATKHDVISLFDEQKHKCFGKVNFTTNLSQQEKVCSNETGIEPLDLHVKGDISAANLNNLKEQFSQLPNLMKISGVEAEQNAVHDSSADNLKMNLTEVANATKSNIPTNLVQGVKTRVNTLDICVKDTAMTNKAPAPKDGILSNPIALETCDVDNSTISFDITKLCISGKKSSQLQTTLVLNEMQRSLDSESLLHKKPNEIFNNSLFDNQTEERKYKCSEKINFTTNLAQEVCSDESNAELLHVTPIINNPKERLPTSTEISNVEVYNNSQNITHNHSANNTKLGFLEKSNAIKLKIFSKCEKIKTNPETLGCVKEITKDALTCARKDTIVNDPIVFQTITMSDSQNADNDLKSEIIREQFVENNASAVDKKGEISKNLSCVNAENTISANINNITSHEQVNSNFKRMKYDTITSNNLPATYISSYYSRDPDDVSTHQQVSLCSAQETAVDDDEKESCILISDDVEQNRTCVDRTQDLINCRLSEGQRYSNVRFTDLGTERFNADGCLDLLNESSPWCEEGSLNLPSDEGYDRNSVESMVMYVHRICNVDVSTFLLKNEKLALLKDMKKRALEKFEASLYRVKENLKTISCRQLEEIKQEPTITVETLVVKTIDERIEEMCKTCNGSYRITFCRGNTYTIKTLYSSVKLKVLIEQINGEVLEWQTTSLLNRLTSSQFAIYLNDHFMHKFDAQCISLAVGDGFTIFTLLDYIQMHFHTFHQLDNDYKECVVRYHLTFEENYRIRIPFSSTKLLIQGEVIADYSDFNSVPEENINVHMKFGNFSNRIFKRMASEIPKGASFLKQFCMKINQHIKELEHTKCVKKINICDRQ